MKKIIIVLIIALGIAAVVIFLSPAKHEHPSGMSEASVPPPAARTSARVPAHYEDAQSAQPLKATLAPEQFFGKAREAYQVAREIPETLAQLPCYCYCDQSIGHKSLHSCYESDHSAQCATCIEEALLAYQLQKEQGLSPAQVREQIIARFSRH